MMHKKQVLFLGIVSLLFLSFFIGVVSAAGFSLSNSSTWGSALSTSLTKWATSGEGLDGALLKILFFILIAILVFGVLGTTGIVTGNGANWAISIIVSFIATAYITPQQFYALGVEYSALGLSLSAILPFLILAFFTFSNAKLHNLQGLFIQRILWLMFAVFLTFRWFELGTGLTGAAQQIATGASSYLAVITICAWTIAIFNNTIVKKIMAMYEDALTDATEAKMKKAGDAIKLWAGSMDNVVKK